MKMNAREMGAAIANETRVQGCNLITLITSNKFYMVSKDWFVENCYQPTQNYIFQYHSQWL